jgi:hypothetical protein
MSDRLRRKVHGYRDYFDARALFMNIYPYWASRVPG